VENFAEVFAAIVAALGGLEGIRWARTKFNSHRYNNGSRDRRRTPYLSNQDREYVRQAIALTAGEICKEMSEVARDEGTKTRTVLQDMERAIIAEVRRSA
jgi:hypothetical protein